MGQICDQWVAELAQSGAEMDQQHPEGRSDPLRKVAGGSRATAEETDATASSGCGRWETAMRPTTRSHDIQTSFQ